MYKSDDHVIVNIDIEEINALVIVELIHFNVNSRNDALKQISAMRLELRLSQYGLKQYQYHISILHDAIIITSVEPDILQTIPHLCKNIGVKQNSTNTFNSRHCHKNTVHFDTFFDTT